MQTQTHRADACTPAVLQAAVKKALTSAAFGQFMTGVVLNAVAEASAAPQGIVLLPMGRARRFRERTTYRGAWSLEVTDAAGNELSMTKEYERPADGAAARFWHPAHWAVHRTLRDERGNIWRAYVGDHVMDDFGDLVEVAA